MKIQKYKNILLKKLDESILKKDLKKEQKISDIIYLFDIMVNDWEIEFNRAIDKIAESEE